MKWIYLASGIVIYLKMLFFPGENIEAAELISSFELIIEDTGVANAVSGVIFRNRVYDTIFEVVVFTIAIMGARFLLANEQPYCTIYQFSDHPSIVLARLGATIAALISVELAIRGHLSPGGGFAAGVAGGTAIGLIAITSSAKRMETIYERTHAATWEKALVLVFIVLAVLTLLQLEPPQGQLGTLISGGWIPLLNIIVAVKVALGSWVAILVFIRYRGLL